VPTPLERRAPTGSAPGAPARFEAWLLERPAGAIAIALAFLAFAATRGLVYLNDEGTLPFEYLQGLHHDPLAILFQSKGKPVLQLLYGLPALAGLRGYLLAHAVVGAVGVWLISCAARRLGAARPNLAGAFFATSTIFAVSAANGIPNADGAVFFSLFLLLYAADRRIAAGVILGMLPLVRHELGVVTVAFVAWDVLRHRRLDLALAVGAFPALYVLAGALYHQDPLWVIRLWVNPTNIPTELKNWSILTVPEALTYHVLAFPNNAPFLAVWALVGVATLFARRRWDLLVLPIVLVLSAAAFVWMQTGSAIAALDLRLRSYLLLVPPMAILVAFGLSFLPGRAAGTWTRLAVLALALAWQIVRIQDPRGLLFDQHQRTHALFDTLRAEGLYTGQTLFTDLQTARYDTCAGIETERTYLLGNSAMRWEVERNTTEATGQRAASIRAFEATRFLLVPERHQVRRDALYLLRRQPRLQTWRTVIEAENPQRVAIGEWDVYRWPQDGPGATPPAPDDATP
jgi:hypothetical protein